MTSPAPTPHVPTPEEFLATSETQEFQQLRRTFRGFAFPVTVAFLAWYIFYIVTATFAVDFVSRPVYGAINLGMVLGLAQFATAGIITWAYVRFADNTLDPATAAIRNRMEHLED
ncbi:DUF485 domain-containing protein [Corynebacterium sp. 13CS0277]|uniref:DUF485 domain-containing protein n=1 Tax=Corynebacterium sp. 13CS0277 TaxID=2071994 RepID=UPI000D02C347|nr:DUF485 domain-containing protein [Corynebacterium sp. 13CS0277]PRQ10990.1 DUF485 domain-containing protein [Corynebacterium sp. 13CS0277]